MISSIFHILFPSKSNATKLFVGFSLEYLFLITTHFSNSTISAIFSLKYNLFFSKPYCIPFHTFQTHLSLLLQNNLLLYKKHTSQQNHTIELSKKVLLSSILYSSSNLLSKRLIAENNSIKKFSFFSIFLNPIYLNSSPSSKYKLSYTS